MAALFGALFCISQPLRSPAHRRAVIGALIAVLLVLSLWQAGCQDDQQTGPDLDAAFLTPVAAAQEAGLSVYWLGPSFEAGGVLFSTREAKFPEGIAGVPLQGLLARYSSQPEAAGFLDLQLLSRSDWDQVMEKVMNPSLPGVTRRAVTVGDREGELLFLPLDTRPLNILRLVLDLGDVVVVAQARSVTASAAAGGGELSPFIKDPDLFVQVMQDLRPYPE
jgi:hypothetical protein